MYYSTNPPHLLFQSLRSTRTTFGSASSVITSPRSFLRSNPVARDSDSVLCPLIRSCHDLSTSSRRRSEDDGEDFEKRKYILIHFSLKVSADGKDALMTLAKGDMRKVLNVLQSTWMAFKDVTEDTVYTCVGHPLKSDIKNIIHKLLNTGDFREVYQFLIEMKTDKGLALEDIITEVHLNLHRSG